MVPYSPVLPLPTSQIMATSTSHVRPLWNVSSHAAGPQDAKLDPITARMEHARCRLVQRGIMAPPMDVAGKFGFCWTPAWGAAAPDDTPASDDSIVISSGGMAGVVVAFTALGAALALGYGSQAKLFSWAGHAFAWAAGSKGSENGASTAAAGAVGGIPGITTSRGGASASNRVVALDQLRGLTMAAMLFVNLYVSV